MLLQDLQKQQLLSSTQHRTTTDDAVSSSFPGALELHRYNNLQTSITGQTAERRHRRYSTRAPAQTSVVSGSAKLNAMAGLPAAGLLDPVHNIRPIQSDCASFSAILYTAKWYGLKKINAFEHNAFAVEYHPSCSDYIRAIWRKKDLTLTVFPSTTIAQRNISKWR